jgi:hypothetical protein
MAAQRNAIFFVEQLSVILQLKYAEGKHIPTITGVKIIKCISS